MFEKEIELFNEFTLGKGDLEPMLDAVNRTTKQKYYNEMFGA